MVNNLSKNKDNARLVVAVVASFVVAVVGLITGLVLGINNSRKSENSNGGMARYLLIDAAQGLNRSLSAMRLCDENTVADIRGDALVFVSRAETAFECEELDWEIATNGERFLNDVYELVRNGKSRDVISKSDIAYEYSMQFLESVKNDKKFEYNGEIVSAEDEPDNDDEIDEADGIAKERFVMDVLKIEYAKFVGGYGKRYEYSIRLGKADGYAMVEGDRLVEFAFPRGNGDKSQTVTEDDAVRIAEECVKACGYDDLTAYQTSINGNVASVRLCKVVDGASACDDCAIVIIENDRAMAFNAGSCTKEHSVPTVKVAERDARKSAPDGAVATGKLVTRTVKGVERVCYEYVYELDDGVHYVYVCAENGKQLQVK